MAKLYDENKIPEKLFSLCLTPSGGSMTLGAFDTSRHNSEIAYAKLAPDPLNTYVTLITKLRTGSIKKSESGKVTYDLTCQHPGTSSVSS